MRTREQDDRIARYLLGDLPEADQLAIEEGYLADPEEFEEIRAAETDLVDRYVRDRLSREQRQLFERNYLNSPLHRERVAFASFLLQAADAEVAEASEAGRHLRGTSPKASRRPSWFNPRFVFAVVVVLLLVSGLSFLALERARLNRELKQAEADLAEQLRQQKEIADQLAAEQDRREKLKAELENLERTTEKGPAPEPERNLHSTISVFLSPMLTRAESTPARIILSPDTQTVQLLMKVESGEARRLHAEIRRVGGGQVWSQRSITPAENRAAASIPARTFSVGDYILTLSAVNQGGDLEELNRYFFTVSRK
jgi:hypothetical protein